MLKKLHIQAFKSFCDEHIDLNSLTVLTGLNPGTTYYVCGFARNDVGTTYSGTTSFKTRLTPGRDNNPTP